MTNKTIAGYTILETLGEGGMGVVHRAVDPTLDRTLAVKVIRTASLNAAARERFLREAKATSRLNHPNIVTVYAAGEEDGCPYIAMEFVEGRTLRQIIDEGPIPWEQAVEWIRDILDALHRLHEEGIVHRDLKPENIMVTGDGTVKLMDFGIARMSSSETLTQDGTTLGTVYYMSPEQASGKKTDARSDLFSIAAVLYQMITGEFPFEGEHPMAVMYSITNANPKPLSRHAVETPENLQTILDRALQKNRADRYSDAGVFRDELNNLLPGTARYGAPAVPRRTRLLRILGGGLVVAFLAVFVFWMGTRGGSQESNRDLAIQHNELGQGYQDDGEIAAAADEYRRAILADPGYKHPWNNLAMLAMSEGDLEEADSLLRRAIEIEPRFATALYNLGTVRWDLKDYGGAEEFYLGSIEADSTLIGGYNNLGALLLERDRPDDARDVLDRGLALYPDQPFLLKNRGLVALRQGDDDKAIQYWTRAIGIDSTIVELHRLAAEWYDRHGYAADARVHWKVVADSPNAADRESAHEALRRLGLDN
jgi:serine/threonine-protein kinase